MLFAEQLRPAENEETFPSLLIREPRLPSFPWHTKHGFCKCSYQLLQILTDVPVQYQLVQTSRTVLQRCTEELRMRIGRTVLVAYLNASLLTCNADFAKRSTHR
jgi:hypothetical protein